MARSDDIPELSGILGELFAQEIEFAPDRAAQTRGLSMILERPAAGRILVAEEEGRAAGMVVLLYSVSTALGAPVATLEDLVVANAFRGRGIGSKLIAFAIETARADHIERITLLTDHDNVGAQRLYERFGFTRSSMVAYRKLLPRSVTV